MAHIRVVIIPKNIILRLIFHSNFLIPNEIITECYNKKSKSTTPTAPLEEANVKMASEASKKAEKDRQERLRLQEEQDLAYAIALSKAEAASLNQ